MINSSLSLIISVALLRPLHFSHWTRRCVSKKGSMSFRVELAAGRRRQPRCSATRGSGVACVEGAVKGGRSPAKRTLEGVRNANTLNQCSQLTRT
jgi:hypothetical protein